MSSRLPAVAALVLAAALLLTACGERSEPTSGSVKLYPVTIDSGLDGQLTLAASPKRVVALDPGAASVIAALGAGSTLVPLPATPDARSLRGLKADLVVASSSTDPALITRVHGATGAPVYVAPLGSYAGVERTARDLGLLVGKPLAGRSLVERLAAAQRLTQERLAGKLPTTIFVDTGFLTSIPPSSYAEDILRLAGGRSVAGTTEGPVAPKELLALDPYLYLLTSDSGETPKDVRRGQHTRNLPAVKAGRIAVVDSRLLEPGADAGSALLTLERLIHPDAAR